jgi:O-antigen ligase
MKTPSHVRDSKLPALFLTIPFLITLYFNVSYADPFNIAKLSLLIIFSSLTISPIWEAIKINRKEMGKGDQVIQILLILFVTSIMLIALTSDHRIDALIGDIQRNNGALTYGCLCLILFYVSRMVNFENILQFFKLVQVITLVLVFYGILQNSGNDFVAWNNPHNPIILTFGNPNYSSACLGLLASCSLLSSLFIFKNIVWRVLGVINGAIGYYLIYESGSRQGSVVYFLILIMFFTFKFAKHYARYRNALYLSFFIIVLAVILGMLNRGPLADLIYKASVSVRGFYWRAGLDMFSSHIFTGVGIDRYGDYFKQFRDVEYVYRYGTFITSTDAHNVFIQLLATTGVFVGLGYLLFNVAIFRHGFSTLLKLDSTKFSILLLIMCCWVGYHAQSFVSINNLASAIWGFYFGGIIYGLFVNNESESKNARGSNKSKFLLLPKLATIPILVSSLILVVQVNRVEQTANLNRTLSMLNPDESNKQILLDTSTKLLKSNLADPIYKLSAAQALINYGFIEQGFNAIDNLIDSDPRFQIALEYMAEARTLDGNFKEASEYRSRIEFLDPYNSKNYLDLIKLQIQLNEVDLAKGTLNKLKVKAPLSEEIIEAEKIFKELP